MKKPLPLKTASWLKNNRLFLVVCGVGLLLYLLISISKHVHFQSTGYDLVIFDQAVRGYSEFSAPASSFRGYENLLGDHFHPILIFLAPLYWIFNSPVSLLVAQAVLFISASLPIYLYGKRKVGKLPAILLTAAFVLSPLIVYSVNFDFHEIAFAVPLIAWVIYLIELKKFAWMYLPLTLLLFVKEDLSLLVVFFGIYLLCIRQFKHGSIVSVVGFAWFILATKIFIPLFAGSGKIFNYWTYGQLGNDIPSSIVGMLKNPLHALSLLFLPVVKFFTLVKTFGIFLGFTFLSPLIILTLPLVLERMFSSNENYWQFGYHYGATIAPILIMATADGIHRFTYKFKKVDKKLFALIICSAIAGLSLCWFMFLPSNSIFRPSNYSFSDFEKNGYETLSLLPKDASICTTNHIAPHLGEHTLTPIGFSVVDFRKVTCTHIVVSEVLDQTPELRSFMQSLKDSKYRLTYKNTSWLIYELPKISSGYN